METGKMKISHITKEEAKYIAMYFIYFLFPMPFTFVHECGHLIMGTLLGMPLKEFYVGLEQGYVIFAVKATTVHPLAAFLVYGGGDFVLSLVLLLLAKKLWSGIGLWIIPSLGYGLWEAGRGVILSMSVPTGIYYAYMATMWPVVWILAAVLYFTITYKVYELERYYYE